MKNVIVPETRGAKRKYDFTKMEVGETRSFEDTFPATLLNSAKQWAKKAGLPWKFRCYTLDGLTHIIRVK